LKVVVEVEKNRKSDIAIVKERLPPNVAIVSCRSLLVLHEEEKGPGKEGKSVKRQALPSPYSVSPVLSPTPFPVPPSLLRTSAR
jgi:hypothetical protein